MVKKNSVKFQNIEETDSPSTEGSSAGSDADMSSLSSSGESQYLFYSSAMPNTIKQIPWLLGVTIQAVIPW